MYEVLLWDIVAAWVEWPNNIITQWLFCDFWENSIFSSL